MLLVTVGLTLRDEEKVDLYVKCRDQAMANKFNQRATYRLGFVCKGDYRLRHPLSPGGAVNSRDAVWVVHGLESTDCLHG